ncbi:hypothetical protein HK102_008858, partial [Quaeritorhiza haematococci]
MNPRQASQKPVDNGPMPFFASAAAATGSVGEDFFGAFGSSPASPVIKKQDLSSKTSKPTSSSLTSSSTSTSVSASVSASVQDATSLFGNSNNSFFDAFGQTTQQQHQQPQQQQQQKPQQSFDYNSAYALYYSALGQPTDSFPSYQSTSSPLNNNSYAPNAGANVNATPNANANTNGYAQQQPQQQDYSTPNRALGGLVSASTLTPQISLGSRTSITSISSIPHHETPPAIIASVTEDSDVVRSSVSSANNNNVDPTIDNPFAQVLTGTPSSPSLGTNAFFSATRAMTTTSIITSVQEEEHHSIPHQQYQQNAYSTSNSMKHQQSQSQALDPSEFEEIDPSQTRKYGIFATEQDLKIETDGSEFLLGGDSRNGWGAEIDDDLDELILGVRARGSVVDNNVEGSPVDALNGGVGNRSMSGGEGEVQRKEGNGSSSTLAVSDLPTAAATVAVVAPPPKATTVTSTVVALPPKATTVAPVASAAPVAPPMKSQVPSAVPTITTQTATPPPPKPAPAAQQQQPVLPPPPKAPLTGVPSITTQTATPSPPPPAAAVQQQKKEQVIAPPPKAQPQQPLKMEKPVVAATVPALVSTVKNTPALTQPQTKPTLPPPTTTATTTTAQPAAPKLPTPKVPAPAPSGPPWRGGGGAVVIPH